MTRILLMIMALVLVAPPAMAAWPTDWFSTVPEAVANAGTRRKSVSFSSPFAVIDADVQVLITNVSPVLFITGKNGHTVCATTSIGTGNGSGALQVRIFWTGDPDGSIIGHMIELDLIVASSTTLACRYDVPSGQILLIAGATATTHGFVTVTANPAK